METIEFIENPIKDIEDFKTKSPTLIYTIANNNVNNLKKLMIDFRSNNNYESANKIYKEFLDNFINIPITSKLGDKYNMYRENLRELDEVSLLKMFNSIYDMLEPEKLKTEAIEKEDTRSIESSIIDALIRSHLISEELKNRNIEFFTIDTLKAFIYILLLTGLISLIMPVLVSPFFIKNISKKNKRVKIKHDIGKILNDHPQGKAYTLSANTKL